MKTICVTGAPGTGKTYLSKLLAKNLNFHYIDVNDFISKNSLSEGYDSKRKSKIVDVKRPNSALVRFILALSGLNKKMSGNPKIGELPKGLIIDSHLSHYLPRKYVNLCIVTKCDIKELNKRLIKREYTKKKIEENIQAEIFDVCLEEAKKMKHKILIVDTTKGFNIKDIAKQLGG